MSVIERSIQVGWQLRVFFTENVFAPDNLILRDTLAATGLRKTVQWYLDHEDWVRAIEDGTYSGQRLGSLEPGN